MQSIIEKHERLRRRNTLLTNVNTYRYAKNYFSPWRFFLKRVQCHNVVCVFVVLQMESNTKMDSGGKQYLSRFWRKMVTAFHEIRQVATGRMFSQPRAATVAKKTVTRSYIRTDARVAYRNNG
uniref:Uncharacterized protein n=1 Tax=Sipha flava TaxID=143950 RepID=A0A2S2QSZ8_9HEMI